MKQPDALACARRYYAGYGRNMQDDLLALGANPHGVIILSPALVLLAKTASTAATDGELLQLSRSPEQADAWYIHLLCGDLALARRLAAHMPALPHVIFHRGARHTRRHHLPWDAIIAPATRNTTTK